MRSVESELRFRGAINWNPIWLIVATIGAKPQNNPWSLEELPWYDWSVVFVRIQNSGAQVPDALRTSESNLVQDPIDDWQRVAPVCM